MSGVRHRDPSPEEIAHGAGLGLSEAETQVALQHGMSLEEYAATRGARNITDHSRAMTDLEARRAARAEAQRQALVDAERAKLGGAS